MRSAISRARSGSRWAQYSTQEMSDSLLSSTMDVKLLARPSVSVRRMSEVSLVGGGRFSSLSEGNFLSERASKGGRGFQPLGFFVGSLDGIEDSSMPTTSWRPPMTSHWRLMRNGPSSGSGQRLGPVVVACGLD